MELKNGLCQLINQGTGSYKYLNGASNSTLYMSNDSTYRGTFWLARPVQEGYPAAGWIFERPSEEGELNDSIAGSGIYLLTYMESLQWYPNPQPYVWMGPEVENAAWIADTFNAAPGCFNFRREAYLNGNPADNCPYRYQVSLWTWANSGTDSWQVLYMPKG